MRPRSIAISLNSVSYSLSGKFDVLRVRFGLNWKPVYALPGCKHIGTKTHTIFLFFRVQVYV